MPRASTAAVPSVAPGVSAVDHVLGAMRAQFATIRVHEPGVRLGTDPEELHTMRTAIRRLGAVLRAVRPMFTAGSLAGLRSELRWLGAVLGAARDADVFREYLGKELGAAGKRLLARLDAERAAVKAGVLAALDDPRYTRLLDRLEEMMRRPLIVADDVSLPNLARRDFKTLRKAVEALPKKPSDRELHTVRIKVKRARFTAELAQAMVGRPAERFVARAHKVQDVLGEHQDAVVAEQRIRDLLEETGGAEGAAADRLLARQRKRRKAARAAFDDQWPKLERRGVTAWT
ncbi:MAG: CHAD domain-containing protein [Candidatus Rokuibacteriota bacterium]